MFGEQGRVGLGKQSPAYIQGRMLSCEFHMLFAGERAPLLPSTQAIFEDVEISRIHISKQKASSLTIRTSVRTEINNHLVARLLGGQGFNFWKFPKIACEGVLGDPRDSILLELLNNPKDGNHDLITVQKACRISLTKLRSVRNSPRFQGGPDHACAVACYAEACTRNSKAGRQYLFV